MFIDRREKIETSTNANVNILEAVYLIDDAWDGKILHQDALPAASERLDLTFLKRGKSLREKKTTT